MMRVTRHISKAAKQLSKKAQVAALSTARQNDLFAPTDTFVHRHNGPSEADVQEMLKECGVSTLKELVDKTIPLDIRSEAKLNIPDNMGEQEALQMLKDTMDKNEVFKSFIGAGYYNTITPKVILRNILENPGWYTPYTPYQAEISQGRLEMLLNFQTMVGDLTGTKFANASLLDEATAAAEAITMALNISKKKQNRVLVADDIHPHTIDVVLARDEPLKKTSVEVGDSESFDFSSGDVAAVLVQYPNTRGEFNDYTELFAKAKENNVKIIVASDLLACTLVTPPAEQGADMVVGNSQRFGVPMGFGGPHAGFFACKESDMRKMPGRVIGVSRDIHGDRALRMTMQTREQHIRRDKATSNICTAQALLANIAAAYAIYHGPKGLKDIATKVHGMTKVLHAGIADLGYTVHSKKYFDTIHVDVSAHGADAVVKGAAAKRINVRKIDNDSVCLSCDETTEAKDLDALFSVFASLNGAEAKADAVALAKTTDISIDSGLARTTEYLTHPTFNKYHSETEMMRYLFHLQGKDLGLNTAMIPLGSCTMKLNAVSEMVPVTWDTVGQIHPFAPADQTQGYSEMLQEMVDLLAEITGFHTVSLQPNAGSQGEFLGLRVIQAYHEDRGEGHRNICLIPLSAHGTNPASAVMNGLKVVTIKCDENGDINMADFKEKVDKHAENLSSLMITYPSTHGVFEDTIVEMCDMVHAAGGQVYMDGANMNAQVGFTSPGVIGADVCHLNLHKTFAIPHGGGGPGMGPIGVAKQLAPFLPAHVFAKESGGSKPTRAIAAAPYSSGSILPISYMYIRMMGGDGLTKATEVAILNANYMAKRLSKYYNILYTGKEGFCAHEFILDLREFKQSAGIVEEDVAKRLQDYNFHAPTMSWPVVGTLMVEPTESESKEECDRLVDALIAIHGEIQEIIDGKADREINVLTQAPHTAKHVSGEKWDLPYSREKAAYPKQYLKAKKFWPTVGRLDNVYGDRNPVCSCPPLEQYED